MGGHCFGKIDCLCFKPRSGEKWIAAIERSGFPKKPDILTLTRLVSRHRLFIRRIRRLPLACDFQWCRAPKARKSTARGERASEASSGTLGGQIKETSSPDTGGTD
jgi:hypothetical protein